MTEASETEEPDRRGGEAGESANDPLEPVGWYFADVPNRLIGYLLDALVISVVVFLGSVILSLALGPVVTFDLSGDPPVTVDSGLAYANVVMATILSAAYFVFTWRRFGGSPGLRLLGMRIWPEDGARLAIGPAVVRWLFIGLPLGIQAAASVALGGGADLLVIAAVLAWYAVLVVSTSRNPAKQGLHDRAARSIVTKAARPAPWVDAGGGPERAARVR